MILVEQTELGLRINFEVMMTMDSREDLDEGSEPQSFIIKVWAEERAGQTDRGIWHGHITHVPSYKRSYLKNLSEIEDFIVPYLEGMGIKFGVRWRMRHWLKRSMRRG